MELNATHFISSLLSSLAISFFVAVGLGLLIGLEREISKKESEELFAGIRTFPLISLLGYFSALLSTQHTYWFIGFTFLGISGLIITSYVLTFKQSQEGTTTEFAALLTFIIGVLCFHKFYTMAISLTITMLFLLSLKIEFHSILKKFHKKEVLALAQFIVLIAIIIPFLPNKYIDSHQIINPRKVGIIVVLVTSLNFIGYFLNKFLSDKKSIMITGFIGGLFSSTALTWNFSKKSKTDSNHSTDYAASIILASSIMFIRVLVVVYILNPKLALNLWIPMIFLTLIGISIAYSIYRIKNHKPFLKKENDTMNPLNLLSSFSFAALYLLILVLIKIGHLYFGETATYIISAISGFTDVDSITISMTQFAGNVLSYSTAEKAIIIAILSNTILKYLLTLYQGHKATKKYASYGFISILFFGTIYLFIQHSGITL